MHAWVCLYSIHPKGLLVSTTDRWFLYCLSLMGLYSFIVFLCCNSVPVVVPLLSLESRQLLACFIMVVEGVRYFVCMVIVYQLNTSSTTFSQHYEYVKSNCLLLLHFHVESLNIASVHQTWFSS